MPIDNQGREPKENISTPEPAARVAANLPGGPYLGPRSRVRGKTTTSIEMAQLLAQRGGDRVLLVDLDPAPSATMEDIEQALDGLGQSYDPIILDCPGGPSAPVSPQVWEEARHTLGLDADDRPTA
ncbi:ParA family protein [Streptomyces tropicalis]|uniref:ParA family protein n=1 Tax=Streptomyces tropicalis TaxID=3034234 RepID=A0ABT6AEG1_9ACTN|nr:ParA family protein [Streptomyces tropicalis]MDF3303031.1 ParA family protein [Streptomyces tropicalis]